MKRIWIVTMIVFLGLFTACSTTKGPANPEVMQKPPSGGDMGGGTGSGNMGDDPTMPDQ